MFHAQNQQQYHSSDHSAQQKAPTQQKFTVHLLLRMKLNPCLFLLPHSKPFPIHLYTLILLSRNSQLSTNNQQAPHNPHHPGRHPPIPHLVLAVLYDVFLLGAAAVETVGVWGYVGIYALLWLRHIKKHGNCARVVAVGGGGSELLSLLQPTSSEFPSLTKTIAY